MQLAVDTARRLSWLKKYLLLILMLIVTPNIKASDTLVLVAAESEPTAYLENGQTKGVLVDILTEAFRRIDHPITILLMPWARCLIEVRDGTVDGIFSVFRLPERESFLSYTRNPIITQTQSFFVRSDSPIVFDGDLSTLSNLKFGIIKGTSYGGQVDRFINDGTWENLTVTYSIESLIAMLVMGRFDITPNYHQVFVDEAERLKVTDKIKALSPRIGEVPSYLAFTNKRDYSTIIAAFDEALAEMKKDGTFDDINKKYLK